MKDTTLIFCSLKARWLNCLLSILLTAFGVALAILIIQFGNHIHDRLTKDGQGIDIVVGSKGSPLQLILSSVYHIDIPTGNIPYNIAKKWMNHPHIETAIPLALGDNWKGYRIVGTIAEYMKHYGAELHEGQIWDKPFEAVAGSHTGLKIGDEFSGAHGFSGDGHIHDDKPYRIVGLMKPTGSVLDRLILTSLNSVLEIHGQESIEEDHPHEHESVDIHEHDYNHKTHEHNDHEHDHSNEVHDHEEHEQHEDHEGHSHEDEKSEITALLLTTKSPVANFNLPRLINRESDLQAANPAYEIARLSGIFGLGVNTISSFSAILIIVAALSIFAGLSGNFESRMKDHAILRALGYTRLRLIRLISMEALIITSIGIVFGFLGSYALFNYITDQIGALSTSGATYHIDSDTLLLSGAILVAGLLAALFPALRSARIDIAEQLGKTI